MADNRGIRSTIRTVLADSRKASDDLSTFRRTEQNTPHSSDTALVRGFVDMPAHRSLQTKSVHPRTKQELTVTTLRPA